MEDLWVAFFMPAFFFITGYCTSFNKPLKEFILTGIKTLLLPALIINTSVVIFDYVRWEADSIWAVKTIIKSFILSATGEWFIPSIFIARIIVWLLHKSDKIVTRLSMAAILFGVGIVLYNSFPHTPNVWYYKHALLVVIFVLVGNVLKERKINLVEYRWGWVGYLYLVVIISLMASGNHVPYIANKIELSYHELPLFFLLVGMGIFSIMKISSMINQNGILEYLGRNSLIIYLLHFIFYRIYIYVFAPYFGVNTALSVSLFVLIITMNIVSCCICVRLLNTRYFKWILGK